MTLPVIAGLPKAIQRKFVTAADQGMATEAHALLASNPLLRQAVADTSKGSLGEHINRNLTQYIPTEVKSLAVEKKWLEDGLYPTQTGAIKGDIARYETLVAGHKSIVAELKALGMKISDKLEAFLKS